jgi:hypothetical protein
MRHGRIRVATAALLFVIIAPGAASRADSTPLPDDRLGVHTAPLLLLSRPDVRADLRLDAEQAESAERAITDLYVRAEALKGKTGAAAIAGRKAIDEAQQLWFDQHLTAEQRNRLVQIDLQWEGPAALVNRPLVAEMLGLTPEQRATLKQAVAQRDAGRSSQTDSRALEQTLAKQALSVLTSTQKERWRVMLGNPFVPQLAASKTALRPAR